MPQSLIECVPNFSEGRDTTVIDAIEAAAADVPGVIMLHRTSDVDHNRTVLTFAGEPQPVLEAAFQSVRAAASHIDMTLQRGVHPRLGAADVVPLVPLRDITLAECATLSRQLGQRIAAELDLPVYLYAAAAERPERRSLAYVRRGEYEGLAARIITPDGTPDYGPATVGRAGAVTVGAREPLIAFNVFLTTDDVQIAQRIARAIRGSSGGLVGVLALGLDVQGQAQVSMNLVDYHRTPLHRVLEMIRREAARYGVNVHRSELIGLMPLDAVLASAAWYLQLDDLKDRQLLDPRLFDSRSSTPE